MPERYYFDHNATTPVAPQVIAAYAEVLREVYGNASSIHYQGQLAKQKLEEARRGVAALLGCDAKEIVFTSGGTESDNLALFGVAQLGSHVITSAVEHPAVLNACAELERLNVDVTYVDPNRQGRILPEDVRAAMRSNTLLVSVMHANNELGTVQDIAAIAAVAHAGGARFHSDGVQAAGRIPVDVRSLRVDLYSLSGHKLCAPKGIGALYVRKGVTLRPRQFGGRHEQGLRAGTENVPGAYAFGIAAALAKPMDSELRDRLEAGILARVQDSYVNGTGAERLPNTLNICIPGIEGESMVIALDLRGFSVSSGAACSSGAVEPSHVLLAIGLTRQEAKSSIRFSLGGNTTREQVDALIEAVAGSAVHLRKVAPAYV